MTKMVMRRCLKSLGLLVVLLGVSLPALRALDRGVAGDEQELPARSPVAVSFGADLADAREKVDAAVSPLAGILMSGTVGSTFAGPPFFYFGDINGDGMTDLTDFAILKANFGKEDGVTRSDGDLNENGAVGLLDFSILKKFFGAKSPYLP